MRDVLRPCGPLPCAVILTALQVEARAVLEHLDEPSTEYDHVETAYSCGTFSVGDNRWKVAVAECGPGNQRAGDVATHAVIHFRPALVLFVGVAGSLKTDVPLGDVVASTKVYNYHSGKAEKDFLPRPAVENTSYSMEQLARLVARTGAWLKRIRRRHPDRPDDPAVHVGPIAAGEQVDADERSHTHKLIKRFCGDALAVEMEGYGTLAATRISKVEAIIVRAISDNVVDKAQCDGKGWQPVAAHYASAFAFELLANYQVGQGTLSQRGPPDPGDPSGIGSTPTPAEKAGRENSPGPMGASPDTARSAIQERFEAASAALLAWPTDLGRGEWITRPELQSIQDTIAHAPHSTTLLLGAPGSGKSALLARLGRELRETNVTVLAIKADTLGEEVKDAATLAAALGLPAPVGEHVRRLSASEKVVILLDQLDALASLVDLRSGRLNALLNLVREMDELPNVHVVCSCREFEHRHDARLTAIEAEVVRLLLPTWEQIAEVLGGRGVPTEGWPPSFQELLRPPQHLKVFLQRLSEPTERQVFSSYQEMLDDLWAKRVTNPQSPAGRSELVMDVATAMANRENLWVPAALFEEREAVVAHLIGVGILTRAREGAGIGFAHQTLFEHAWARAFARERCSLADYTLARQDGLFIRSTAWAGLTYLRGADPANYRREFGRLWNRTDLRLHLRHLLVEFLGGVGEPDAQEQAWLFGTLANRELEGKVLSAVRGNPGWFAVLSRNHLPRLMRAGTPNTGLLVWVLIAAWPFARSECLRLVRDNWLPDPAKDEFSWQALSYLPEWDEEVVEIACTIVARTPVRRGAVLHLAAQVVGSSPALAPRIVAVGFRREIEEIEREPAPTPPALPDDASASDQIVQMLTFNPNERFRCLLEDRNGWYGVEELAEKAPNEFLAHMWPLFSRTLDRFLRGTGGSVAQFRQDYCLGLAFRESDEGRNYPLPTSIELAVRTLARDTPADFLKLLEAERRHDSEAVQRLLARGLIELAGSHTELALRFLLEDERRFELGSHSDRHEDTICLIQALAPHLSDGQFRELETAIGNWSRIQADSAEHNAEERFQAQKYNRRRRLRLLAALPPERLSPEARALVRLEQEVFPDHVEAGVSRIQGGFIGSPMSDEQMQRASNRDIVNLFRELPDATESHHPRDWMRGGSEQASGEFVRFATASPDRAVAILAEFEPGQQEVPAGSGLIGLSKSNYADEALFQVVFDLDARGFRSEPFRIDAARAIEARLKNGVGLPDPVCDLLERWLAEPWQVHETSHAARETRPERQERPTSVLWQRGGMYALPYGTYHLLHALTYGYLLRKRPATETWLAALEAHCERPEQTETWLALARDDLRYLHLCDHAGAACFLGRLFERFPGVLEREEGAVLLTNVWSFVPAESLWVWLSRLRQGIWAKGAQAYGELLGLRVLIYPEDERARREIEAVLGCGPEPPADLQAVRTGVAFACANLWKRADTRRAATECLVRLILDADDDVGSAVMHLFIPSDSLLPDDATHQLLDALMRCPQVLVCTEEGWFIERLERLLPNEAETVCRLCREVIRLRGQDFGSIQRSWSMHAANLTSVALTLHRLDDPYRGMGLELFEALLDIRLPDAEAALREIDLRPPGKDVRVLPQRHRRRRRGAEPG
jgi:nucleoside phosphorylase